MSDPDHDARPLVVFVAGRPVPQGSKRFLGRGVLVESSKSLAPWRADCRDALLDADGHPIARFDGAVRVELSFIMPRPASTPKRSTPPAVRRPDLDKLARAVLDAVSSAGVWRDDSQVVELVASKRIAEIDESPGCRITLGDVGAPDICPACGAEPEQAGPPGAEYLFRVHEPACRAHPQGPAKPRAVR